MVGASASTNTRNLEPSKSHSRTSHGSGLSAASIFPRTVSSTIMFPEGRKIKPLFWEWEKEGEGKRERERGREKKLLVSSSTKKLLNATAPERGNEEVIPFLFTYGHIVVFFWWWGKRIILANSCTKKIAVVLGLDTNPSYSSIFFKKLFFRPAINLNSKHLAEWSFPPRPRLHQRHHHHRQWQHRRTQGSWHLLLEAKRWMLILCHLMVPQNQLLHLFTKQIKRFQEVTEQI